MIRFLSFFILMLSCSNTSNNSGRMAAEDAGSERSQKVEVGAEQLDALLPKLAGKSVALVVNHTALLGSTHLADTLKSSGVRIVKIFAPEHGFRGTAEAGESVKDGMDVKTGLPLVSLYGKNKKPTQEQLADVDIVIFDIQDVGARFYTYISTLHYVMEACAENKKKLIVLDRPNPNGRYVDGPVLQADQKSFVGMHAIPIVHGLTIAELALMINGEKWIAAPCDLEIMKVKHWKHSDAYSLPMKPSPNLPTAQAIQLYPSLCLFEGTVISVGRGTQTPFEVIGHPALKNLSYTFTPVSIEGMSKNPPCENQLCYGLDLQHVKVKSMLDLSYLIQFYKAFPDKEKFFIPFFDKLAGNVQLKEQIKSGMTEEAIRATWKKDLDAYRKMRSKYLMYP